MCHGPNVAKCSVLALFISIQEGHQQGTPKLGSVPLNEPQTRCPQHAQFLNKEHNSGPFQARLVYLAPHVIGDPLEDKGKGQSNLPLRLVPGNQLLLPLQVVFGLVTG